MSCTAFNKTYSRTCICTNTRAPHIAVYILMIVCVCASVESKSDHVMFANKCMRDREFPRDARDGPTDRRICAQTRPGRRDTNTLTHSAHRMHILSVLVRCTQARISEMFSADNTSSICATRDVSHKQLRLAYWFDVRKRVLCVRVGKVEVKGGHHEPIRNVPKGNIC